MVVGLSLSSKGCCFRLLLLSTLFLFLLMVVVLPDSVCSFRPNNPNKAAANSNKIETNGSMDSFRSQNSNIKRFLSGETNDTDNNTKEGGITVGFIGCGTIASSIARGLALAAANTNTNTNAENEEDSSSSSSNPILQIQIQKMVVSMRSQSKSMALFGDLSSSVNISVDSNNQNILDACDLVFLTVLPNQASEVLGSLEFDPNRHVLVSLVSTANLQDLVRDSKLDLSRVAKMICLPSIAKHKGVALLCCGDDGTNTSIEKGACRNTRSFLSNLFGRMGGVVCLDTEADLEACMVTTCTMGPLYGTMKNQRDWLLRKTDSLSKADATFLVIQQFAGAISDAASALQDQEVLENKLEALIAEQTPGGLNEQALKNYGTVLGGFESVQDPVMDAILSRIRGDTDGSIASKATPKADS